MPQSKTILFRISSRGQSPGRSLERSMILAETHMRDGGQTLFATDSDAHEARARLAARGLASIALSAEPGSNEDLAQTILAISECDADAAFVDGPLSSEYLRKLATKTYVAVLDDDASQVLPVQLIINSSMAADERFYTCRADTSLLLGPRFALLEPAISDWPSPERERGLALRIILSSDKSEDLCRMIHSLPTPSQTTIVTIVADGTSPEREDAMLVACARGYIVEEVSSKLFSDALLFSDAAIATSGCNTALLAYWGIPTLTFACDAGSQRDSTRLWEEGANLQVSPLTDICDTELREHIESFMSDEAMRYRLGKSFGAIVDGRGAERVLEAMHTALAPRVRQRHLHAA